MKITNKLGLPEALIDGLIAIRNDYQRGECDFTATQLSRPPMIVRLERDHSRELEEDAEDMMWSAFGSAFHLIAARGASKARQEIAEMRLSSTFEGKFGRKKRRWVVSGQADLYERKTETIYDYKTVSPWVMVFNTHGQPEWEHQLNVLAELFVRNQMPVRKLADVLLFRGWSQSDSKRNTAYPISKVMVLEQRIWPGDQVNSFVVGRCALLSAALECDENKIGTKVCPPCTRDEQWCRAEGWAVQKIGRQRAKRVFKPDQLEAANKTAADLGSLFMVLPRFGRRARCESNCAVNKWCPDWKRYLEQLNIAEGEKDEEGPPNPMDWENK